MKINLLFLLSAIVLTTAGSLFSQKLSALDFQKTAPLYEHLCEVNTEWKKISPDADLLVLVNFPSDRERIQKHLELVENELRAREISSLSSSQKANRLRHLEVLRGYRQTGVFPTNHYHAARQPYFRDNLSVLCAVGFLMWEDGQHDIVNKINLENNYAYIAELAVQYPELKIWAKENGFTLNELAWVQPAYDPVLPVIENWGNGGGLNTGGRINVMAKNENETKLFVAGKFSEIDGFAANNIAMWDGSSWHKLGEGVTGEVFALEYYHIGNVRKLYVAGNFYLPGQSSQRNIAEYDLITNTWKGLQTGDMEGSVYVLHKEGFLYIGGDFQKVNGTNSPFLANYNEYNQTWNSITNHFVDGPVHAIESVGNFKLIGGDFKKVYQPDEGAWVDAPHLAYASYSGGWQTFSHPLPPVRSLAFFEGNVFTGHEIELDNDGSPKPYSGVNILKGGLWFDVYCFPMGNGTVNGFYALDDRIYAYGGFVYPGLNFGEGGVEFYGENTTPAGAFITDSTIRSVLEFQNDLYITGDFQHLWQNEFPGLARIKLGTSSFKEPGDQLPVQVIATPDRLRVNYKGLEQEADLVVYDLQGRPLARQVLPSGDGEWSLDVQSDWASGLYVWHLENADGRKVGKWVIAN